MTRATALTLLAGGLGLALVIGAPMAMADGTATPGASPTATPSTSAGPLVGGSPATWSPLHATRAQSGSTITLVPKQAVLFDGFSDKAHFTSSNPKVFVAEDAEGKGTYTAQAGGYAVTKGRATVTVTRGTKHIAHFTIVVK